ncbi:MAG TPA: hypothetical protein VFE47_06310 [Tepidisphaeraceae bacterium]|jgi:hypothetical protein|nr:hypothetical protein [Tepidisphaeraceae bacterium]
MNNYLSRQTIPLRAAWPLWFIGLAMIGITCASTRADQAPAAAAARFAPNPKLDLPDTTAVDLGPFDWERPEGEPFSGAVTDYSGMVYDMHNHRVLLFGGGHAATYTDAIYSFDLATLKWSALYKPTPRKYYTKENLDRGFWKSGDSQDYPRPVGRHTYDLLVVPDDQPGLWMLMNGVGPSMVAPGFGYFGGAAGHYDFKTGRWKILPKCPFGGYGGVSEYDPVSKQILGTTGQVVWFYDPQTGASKQILENITDLHKVSGYSGTMIYFPPDEKFYTIPQNKKVWSLQLNRADLTKSTITPLKPAGSCPESECAFAYDAKNKIIGGGVKDDSFYVYDPAKNAWLSQPINGAKPGTMTFHCLVYSPVDNAYIFIANKRTWAYRLKK